MEKQIKFYRSGEVPYGVFSNFSRRYPITIGGKEWPSSEHYFQAQKFAGTEFEEKVRRAGTPAEAAALGRDRALPLRKDWEQVKNDVMMIAIREKFTQYPELKAILLQTGDAELIEHTANDVYWGDGGDGSGQNRLGKLLVALRTELRGDSELT